jgi:hypothetical protein
MVDFAKTSEWQQLLERVANLERRLMTPPKTKMEIKEPDDEKEKQIDQKKRCGRLGVSCVC